MTLPAIFFIIILVLVVALIWLHYARVQAGRVPERRPLPALEVLRAALARSAETGPTGSSLTRRQYDWSR